MYLLYQLHNLKLKYICPPTSSRTYPPNFNLPTSREMDRAPGRVSRARSHFNPPTPRGVGRRLALVHLDKLPISIHPPREGWDVRHARLHSSPQIFQSTHPARGGTASFRTIIRRMRYFNPPTPRGVGPSSSTLWVMLFLISIHPPREGWDRRSAPSRQYRRDFNPPTPRGVGLHMIIIDDDFFTISIHPPREGWDATFRCAHGR